MRHLRSARFDAQAPVSREQLEQPQVLGQQAPHLDTFLREYDTRFSHSHGPLPPEADKVLSRLAHCGDPNEGVTLLHCKECQVTLAVPHSCKTRICPSWANRRAEHVAEKLSGLLPEVPYRHLVFTLPKKMGIRTDFARTAASYAASPAWWSGS